MEPNKFDNQIRQELQKREIKPSAGSWEKLEGRLEQKEKPSKPNFWWIGAAAAIAGVFFMLGTFFGDPASEGTPAVVENTPEKTVPSEEIQEPEKETFIATQKRENQEQFFPEVLPKKIEKPTEVAIAAEKVVPEEDLSEELFIEEQIPIPSQNALAEQSLPDAKYDAEAEVEALLAQATAEIEENPTKYGTSTVDAGKLLHEVEYELEQSFRQKVFEAVKEGISKAKTAVANGNF